jgi:hypothetical protein
MATETVTDLELFYRFVGESLTNGGKDRSPEESLQAFRAYQRELAGLRKAIEPSLERSLRGESLPFDATKIKRRVTEKLAKEGITE